MWKTGEFSRPLDQGSRWSSLQFGVKTILESPDFYIGSNATGCPEDGSNFGTYGNSGIDGDMRLSFGLLREGMCEFNYM